MGSPFVCFVQVYGQKLDIVADDHFSPFDRPFSDIYRKIFQICKYAFNEDITSRTHVYELVNPFAKQSSIIISFATIIKHFSIIRLRPKAQTLRPYILSAEDSDVVFIKDNSKNIFAFHLMMKSIDKTWNFIDCPQKWSLVSEKLRRMDTKFEAYDATVCETTINKITSFYIKAFDKLNLKLEPQQQKMFDLLKSVHSVISTNLFDTSLATSLQSIADRPEMRDYFKYGFNVDLKTIDGSEATTEELLRMGNTRVQLPPNPLPAIPPPRQLSNTSNQTLSGSESLSSDPDIHILTAYGVEIEAFKTIVDHIDPQWNFRKKGQKWSVLYQNIKSKHLPFPTDYNGDKCEQEFVRWTKFYIKTFDKFHNKFNGNSNIDSILKSRFDLLRSVEKLKVDRIFVGEYSGLQPGITRIKGAVSRPSLPTNPAVKQVSQSNNSSKSSAPKSSSRKLRSHAVQDKPLLPNASKSRTKVLNWVTEVSQSTTDLRDKLNSNRRTKS